MVARRGHPLQPEEKQQIVKLHEAGYTQVAIAEKLNRSKPTISSYLKGMPPGMGGKMYRQAKDALEAGAPKEPKEWRTQAKMAIEDIAYFARRYYGCIIMPFQEEGLAKIMELLDTPQREYVVINQAPGTGKSMFFTRIVPAWLTVQRRDIRGMIGSISQGMATRYLEALRNDFTRRQPIQPSSSDIAAGISVDAEACLVDDFGRFRPEAGGEDSWTQRGFTVAQLGRRPTPHKEQTWIAVGAETEYIGTRVDIAIWDDAWSDSFTTVESKQRFYRSFDMVAERRLEPHGLLVLQGQRMASDDIYRYCLDKRAPADDDDDLVLTGQMYHHIKFPAHFDDRCEGKHDKRIAKPYPDGCLLYPKRVPWSDLRMIRDKSMAEYQLLYQQEDADLDDCLVKEIWVKGGEDADGSYPGCWDWRRDLCQLPEGLNRGLSVCSVDVSPTQYWACLAGNSMVMTSDGEVPIERVRAGDAVMTRKGWRFVTRAAPTGVKPVLEIGLSTGNVLRCTADHQVFGQDGWTEAGDLAVGTALHAYCSSAHVLGSRDILEMGWVATEGLTAQMVELAFDAASGERGVRNPVGEPAHAKVTADAGRAVWAFGAGTGALPDPAPELVDFAARQEVLSGRFEAQGSGLGAVGTGVAGRGFVGGDRVPAWAWVHVTSIHQSPPEQVYDLEIEDAHEFVADGVLVHNCQWWYIVDTGVGNVRYRYLLDLEGVKMQSGQFLDYDTRTRTHTGLAEEWMARSHKLGCPIRYWVAEINAAQRFLFQYQHVREWQAKWNCQILPHTTGRNKSDPELGVGQLGKLYRNGLVRLPGLPQNVGGNAARWKSLRLVDEGKKWRPGVKTRDDQILAQWFVEFNLPKMMTGQQAVPAVRDDIPSWVQASA